MTAYRVGQRVRIEWPDGTAVVGVLQRDASSVAYGNRQSYCDSIVAEQDGATITVLSDPRPDEPMQLGAVVEAAARGYVGRLIWVRLRTTWTANPRSTGRQWGDLLDPVVLHEGWTP